MRLTHLGHACLLVEVEGARILIDPGNLAGDFTVLEGLDLIAMTHQHPDHADPERLPALVARNPDALVVAEPQAAEVVAEQTHGAVRARPLSAGEPVQLHDVTVRPVGHLHAEIHESLPRIGNLGLVVSAAGAPTLFHPGDSYDADPGAVDILGVPVNAPWAKISATADFVRRIQPRIAVPIHDGLLNDSGRELYLRLTNRFGPDGMRLLDLSDGQPVDLA
jgi:L-ascorbate metabolism protein UlaG (beta-lactamase superfamily)